MNLFASVRTLSGFPLILLEMFLLSHLPTARSLAQNSNRITNFNPASRQLQYLRERKSSTAILWVQNSLHLPVMFSSIFIRSYMRSSQTLIRFNLLAFSIKYFIVRILVTCIYLTFKILSFTNI